MMTNTPRELGYRMPAEWEPHEATWLAWPHKEASWPGLFEQIPPIWIEMIRILHTDEMVHLCVNDAKAFTAVQNQLWEAGLERNIHMHQIPTNDAWMRDYGPLFVVTEQSIHPPLVALDWVFNSWGEKYGPWDLDDEMPQHACTFLGLPCHEPGIVLEGGSIDVNGRGALLTTEQCLLNKNRNSHLSKVQIETYLSDYLGVSKILWLGEGIVGDDTDGHVDDIARFVSADTVVAAVEQDPADENYKILQDNLKRLQHMKDQDGRLLNVVFLPMPGPVLIEDQRLPASYLNFYIANSVVLVPIFDDPQDTHALEILQRLFPDRRVVGLQARQLVWGLGAFHCVTQQQPRV